jgi:tetrahydromethanopterin S-methyltransferase subunit G
MKQMSSKKKRKNRADVDREVMRAVARLKAGILGLVFGLIFGIGLFAMTAILLIESGPNAGHHLRLLGNYFVGYTVTWKGAFIGFLWAFATGALIGWSIGIIYNRIVGIRTNLRP